MLVSYHPTLYALHENNECELPNFNRTKVDEGGIEHFLGTRSFTTQRP